MTKFSRKILVYLTIVFTFAILSVSRVHLNTPTLPREDYYSPLQQHRQQEHEQKDHEPKLYIVVSFCKGSLSWLWDVYLTDATAKKSAFIFTRCGSQPSDIPPFATFMTPTKNNPGGCLYCDYAQFLSLLMSKSQKLGPPLDEDAMILFFGHHPDETRATAIKKRKSGNNFTESSFEEKMLSLSNNESGGFVCVRDVKGNLDGLSGVTTRFYETSMLQEFSSKKLDSQQGDLINNDAEPRTPSGLLGSWASVMGIPLDDEIVPVCFGGQSLTTVRQLRRMSQKKKLNWEKIVDSLSRSVGTEEEFQPYMERTWASIFSDPVSDERKNHLKGNQFGVCDWKDSFHGMILLESEILKRPETIRFQGDGIGVHVVVAFCEQSLHWIWNEYLVGVNVKSIYVFSKCGSPAPRLPPAATLITYLPNLGGCEHTYAHFLSLLISESQLLSSSISEDDAIVFIKDNSNSYRVSENSIPIREAEPKLHAEGFACLRKTIKVLSGILGRTSRYYEASMLRSYSLDNYAPHGGLRVNKTEWMQTFLGFNSTFRPYGNWTSAMGIPIDDDILPLCFGGFFMTTVRQAKEMSRKKNLNWTKIANSLARGINTEELHYMERSWAHILSNKLPVRLKNRVRKRQLGVCNWKESFFGMIVLARGADLG